VEADLRPFNLGLASGFKKARTGQNYLARTHVNGYVTDKPRMMMMMIKCTVTYRGSRSRADLFT